MKASVSLELIVQIAAHEAITGEHAEILPDHLFSAMLKLSELPRDQVGKVTEDPKLADDLANQVAHLHDTLAKLGIDTASARRTIRSKLGKGDHPYDGGKLHRSNESRQLFDAAVHLATDTGKEMLTANHLLQAILTAPTPLMREVLGSALPQQVSSQSSNTPLIDEHGIDLTQLARRGDLSSTVGREMEAKTLLLSISQTDRPCLLLVTDNDDTVRLILHAAAKSLIHKDAPASLHDRRLIDISSIGPAEVADKEAQTLLRHLFTEALYSSQVTLYLPAIQTSADASQSQEWSDLLKRTLTDVSCQCICRVEPEVYETSLAKDPKWRTLAETIWICDETEDDIPREL